MNEPFKDLEAAKAIKMPLAMRHALRMSIPADNPIPYDPPTQMSIFGGDAVKMMGSRDKSTCTRESSTRESVVEGWVKGSDSDRGTDD
jgi:hypothetical protein